MGLFELSRFSFETNKCLPGRTCSQDNINFKRISQLRPSGKISGFLKLSCSNPLLDQVTEEARTADSFEKSWRLELTQNKTHPCCQGIVEESGTTHWIPQVSSLKSGPIDPVSQSYKTILEDLRKPSCPLSTGRNSLPYTPPKKLTWIPQNDGLEKVTPCKYSHDFGTPRKIDIAHQNRQSQKETHLPTIIFQGLCSISVGVPSNSNPHHPKGHPKWAKKKIVRVRVSENRSVMILLLQGVTAWQNAALRKTVVEWYYLDVAGTYTRVKVDGTVTMYWSI